MKRHHVLVVVALAGLAALAAPGCSYNRFVGDEEAIKAQWAQVENQLQRRNDLIPNLVETTKGYAGHESDVFKAVADSHSQMLNAKTPEEKISAANQQTQALGRLLLFYMGKIGNAPGDYLPFPVTAEILARGRERFNINCTPCHGRVGDGNGFIPSRGFRRPPSYHIERLRTVPLGYFFDVMTNGFGVMPEYGTQVSARDRWCIAAYIRALQLSQNATSADVPEGQEVPSPAPEFRDIGNGATLPEVKLPSVEAPETKKEEPK